MKLNIIFRYCDIVDSFSGVQPRIKPKPDVVRRCFNSMIYSLSQVADQAWSFDLHTVDDRSSYATQNAIFLKGMDALHKDNGLLSGFHRHQATTPGNGGSLAECYKIADGLPDNEWVFFIEDDYLFHPAAFDEILYFASLSEPKLGLSQVVIHPVDYIDRYTKPYQSYITLGKTVHWRTIVHTTGTFMMPVKTFKRFRKNYEDFTKYGTVPGITEDTSVNLTYKHVPCFSPMPSVAHHFQYESTLSPFLDWVPLWEANE